MTRFCRSIHIVAILPTLLSANALAAAFPVTGQILDPNGKPVSNASVRVGTRHTSTTSTGRFFLDTIAPCPCKLAIASPGFQSLTLTTIQTTLEVRLTPALTRSDSVVVTADINDLDVISPDPGEKVFVRADLLDANPGRPGAPVSIPGYPIETASSGIKAPQYFAPGVAGDHGEPIAQYIQVGTYLLPNNLSANAHGNGYADPNLFVPEILESVQIDGGAFNVRQGNHAVNLAAIYGLRSTLDPFATLTFDDKDLDLATGLSPSVHSFLALEASIGNGFLRRLEHRQQYKLNTQRSFILSAHTLTLFAAAYYGTSYLPGLTPVDANSTDSIDPRQRDQTHTALIAANDVWRLTERQQLQLSGHFRTYNLALLSNFGDGLIRQSEFRTVTGESTNYINKFSDAFQLLAAFDYNREAPRRDNLDRYGPYTGSPTYGPFTKVTSNNVTISSLTPYGAASGALSPFFRYYAGWRRDEIQITNQDLLHAANSFDRHTGVNSPKATVSFLPQAADATHFLPQVSASFGESFYTEDPRIGTGITIGTPVARAHSYQLVFSKTLAHTDAKLTLGHVTTSQSLAKIDADTGLQEDEGPGRLRFLTAAVRQSFTRGSILVTYSKADARDLDSGNPTPEAPRTIFDILANTSKLPLGLQARGEFEFVGRKTLGTGCAPNPDAQCLGVAVKEFRAAVVRPFADGRFNVGINLLFASGYTGQTLEALAPSDIPRVVGVRIPSYTSVNLTYKFGHK